ncbi:hypothetical protein ACWIB8_08335 [Corynebacterium flavescens]
MSAPEALNFHPRHIDEFHGVILSGLTNQEARDAVELVHSDDYGAYWQGRTIGQAISTAATAAIEEGRAQEVLTVLDVNAALMEQGALKDASFVMVWTGFISPQIVPPMQSKARLPELARRIVEDHFRMVHADIYGGTTSYEMPLADLCTQMDRDRQRLLSIYSRMSSAPTLKAVNAGDAA